jgi:UDP-N-acetylmuramate dehydrogenase
VSNTVNLTPLEQLNIIEHFKKVLGISVRTDVLGRDLTTFKVGGNIPILCEASSITALAKLITFLASNKLVWRVIGNGSNVLIPDEGLKHILITLKGEFKEYQINQKGTIKVGGATNLMLLTRKVAGSGFSGLEFASGIPASLGGALKMNAGAHGTEICEIVESIDVIGEDGVIKRLNKQELKWSYRKLSLPEKCVVVGAQLQLAKGNSEKIELLRQKFLNYRQATQPLTSPSCGSVFKNPLPHRAGTVIEDAGLKGFFVGGAQVSELHANWIINPNKEAQAREIVELIKLIQDRVQYKFKIKLVTEVDVW